MWATTAIKVCEWCGKAVTKADGLKFRAVLPSEHDSIFEMRGYLHDIVCSQEFWDHITTLGGWLS